MEQSKIETSKKCTKCGIEKMLTEYHLDKSMKSGLKSWCKSCVKVYSQSKKDYIKAYQKVYARSEKRKDYFKAYNQSEEGKFYHKVYSKAYELSEKRKIYNQSEKRKKYYQSEKCKVCRKAYKQSEKFKENYHQKYKTDLKFNLNEKMRNAIGDSLKGNKAGRHWEFLVNYSLNDLIMHLKSTMPDNYTWNDYLSGKLQIDHIIPISAFTYSKVEDLNFKKCWALENLRLLSAKENRVKHAKLIKPFQLILEI